MCYFARNGMHVAQLDSERVLVGKYLSNESLTDSQQKNTGLHRSNKETFYKKHILKNIALLAVTSEVVRDGGGGGVK